MTEPGASSFIALVQRGPWAWRDASRGLLPVLGPLAAAHRRGQGYGGRFGLSLAIEPGADPTDEQPDPPAWLATWTPLDPPVTDAEAARADLIAWFALLRVVLGMDPVDAPADDVTDELAEVVPPDVARAAARLQHRDPHAANNASVLRAIVGLATDQTPGVPTPAPPPDDADDGWGAWDDAPQPEDELPIDATPPGATDAVLGLRDDAVSPAVVIVALLVVMLLVVGIRLFVEARARVIPACQAHDECRTGNCSNGYCAPLGMALVRVPRDSNDPAMPADAFFGIHEVTQAEFRAAVGNDPSWFQGCGAGCPVESVSVYDAILYLNTLSRREGLPECYQLEDCRGTPAQGCERLEPDKADHGCDGRYTCETVRFAGMACEGYRLPTAAEWQHAAMGLPDGGQLDIASALNSPGWIRDVAYVDYPDGLPCLDDNGEARACGPTRADDDVPNAWGLYHMSGNVQEWVYAMGQDVAGWEAADARELGRSAVTGGAWAHGAGEASIARSVSLQGATLFTDLGFRVARTAFRDAVR